jgi:hypothetical protein
MKRRRKTTTSKTQSQLAVSMNRFEGIQLFKVAGGERALQAGPIAGFGF